MQFTAIITSAGRGTRAGLDKNKLLYNLDGETVLQKTVKAFLNIEKIEKIILTASLEDKKIFEEMFASCTTPLSIVLGGETREDSVYNALVTCETEGVIVHDGARPFVAKDTILKVIDSVEKFGSGVAVIPPTDTIADIDLEGRILRSSRSDRAIVQTPQGFLTKELIRAFELSNKGDFTDESGMYSKHISAPFTVNGSSENVKLTYKKDLENHSKQDYLVGVGFDLHRLVEGRKLILGGVEIPHTKGLLGHSDADVLTHAIMDSILSCCHLRDIGYHFSDKDPKFKDISSMVLLDRVLEMISEKGYKVNNVSAVIMAEKPKLMSHIPAITLSLATALNLPEERVGITCTTMEGIGIVGREEGIAVNAYSSVIKQK